MNLRAAILSALFLLVLLPGGSAGAQARYVIDADRNLDLRLLGTSTLHDWQMRADAVSGDAVFAFAPGGRNELLSLTSLTFSLAVEDLHSGNRSMDNNAHRALKAEAHPVISYVLTSETHTADRDGYRLTTRGELTIAGVTRAIDMEVQLRVNDDGSLTAVGSHTLNMTDYGVTPPSFLLGAMKTGEVLSLRFTVIFTPAARQPKSLSDQR